MVVLQVVAAQIVLMLAAGFAVWRWWPERRTRHRWLATFQTVSEVGDDPLIFTVEGEASGPLEAQEEFMDAWRGLQQDSAEAAVVSVAFVPRG